MRARVARILGLLVVGACLNSGPDARAMGAGIVVVLVVAEIAGAIADSPLG